MNAVENIVAASDSLQDWTFAERKSTLGRSEK